MLALSVPARRAFSLIELLVVVAIIVLLVSILVPAAESARQKAIESVCGQTLRAMMVGIQGYMAENRDYFPPYGHKFLYGDRPPVSTVFAAVLNRGRYTGPTWCPNIADGWPEGAPDRAAKIKEIKKDKDQKLFGYAYNPQVGYLVQDPATGEYIYYDPHGENPPGTPYFALRARMYTELKRPDQFAFMGCGGAAYYYGVWVDSNGTSHAVPWFQALHGTYRGWKVRGPGLCRTGPRERGNIMFADGHVQPIPELWEVDRYAEKYYLWPGED